MDKQYKILLVDDSPEWLNIYKNMIAELFGGDFFRIDTAKNGREGFNIAVKQNDYDLIITDLEMEKIFDEDYAGSWMVKNLIGRDEFKNTKFLIISGAYNIWDIANNLKVQHIAKSALIGNPLLLKYKIDELLNLGNL